MIIGEILLGAALGFIAGLTGAGGAALALPGLIFLLGASAVQAVATTFPFTAIMKVFGSYQHIRQGSVHWGVTADLLIGSLPGTIAGVFIVSFLVNRLGEEFNDWLKVIIGALLVASVFLSAYARRRGAVSADDPPQRGRNIRGILFAGLCGLAIGATSVGGGSLLIVVMLMLYRIRPAEIVGTSIAVSVALMLVGTAGFWQEGSLDMRLALTLSAGGVPGVILGSMMTMRVSPRLLSQVVMGAITLAGVSLVVQGGLSLAGAL
ncbi:MAG: sulfite exporter TauE/SafE family protein [Dehalococcoidia bacterium]